MILIISCSVAVNGPFFCLTLRRINSKLSTVWKTCEFKEKFESASWLIKNWLYLSLHVFPFSRVVTKRQQKKRRENSVANVKRKFEGYLDSAEKEKSVTNVKRNLKWFLYDLSGGNYYIICLEVVLDDLSRGGRGGMGRDHLWFVKLCVRADFEETIMNLLNYISWK